VQVRAWANRGAIEKEPRNFPGRPISGSEPAAYPDDAVETIRGLAAALDEKPDSFGRAVLVAFRRGFRVGDRALFDTYEKAYGTISDHLSKVRGDRSRVRFPAGILSGPLDSLAKETLFELALDEVPITDGVIALTEVMGLDGEVVTFPPDPQGEIKVPDPVR
jgi:hypothetical protein